MPSKLSSAAAASSTVAGATGCVEGRWAAAYPQVLRLIVKALQPSVNRVVSAATRTPRYSANDSLSHRSSHHRMVTRSPNHMCAISWATTMARTDRSASVTADRNTNSSRNVTHAGFSIAPALNSGTKTWSYLPNGYLVANSSW